MTTSQDSPRPCMAIADIQLKLDQVQAAMMVMMETAQATSDTPVCMAIVDAAGNSEAVAKMGEREIDALTKDTRVIRNRRKLEAIVENANRMIELETEHGSFRSYLHSLGDFEATVAALRKQFKFLGETGSYGFLYIVGEPVPPHDEWRASRQTKA